MGPNTNYYWISMGWPLDMLFGSSQDFDGHNPSPYFKGTQFIDLFVSILQVFYKNQFFCYGLLGHTVPFPATPVAKTMKKKVWLCIPSFEWSISVWLEMVPKVRKVHLGNFSKSSIWAPTWLVVNYSLTTN